MGGVLGCACRIEGIGNLKMKIDLLDVGSSGVWSVLYKKSGSLQQYRFSLSYVVTLEGTIDTDSTE